MWHLAVQRITTNVMDSSEQSPHLSRRRIIFYSLLLLAIVLAFIWLIAYLLGERTLTKALKQARELGPVTLAELEANRRHWSPQQDAGPRFMQLCKELVDHDKARSPEQRDELKKVPLLGDVEFPPLGHLWPINDQLATIQYLASMAPFYAELDALRQYPGGEIPLDLKVNPLELLIPSLSPLREAIKMECLVIQSHAMMGPVEDLLDRMQVMGCIRTMIQDQPTLISALVVIAADSVECDALERAMGLNAIRPQDLAPLENLLTRRKPYDSLKTAMLGERAIFLELAQRLRNGTISGSGVAMYARTPIINIGFMLDTALGARAYNDMLAASLDPLEMEAIAHANEQRLPNAPFWAVLTKLVMPSLERGIELIIRVEGQLRATRTALAIERFRLDHTRFPEALSELVPSYMNVMPIDPFDNQPLRYRRTPEGVVVYSIGSNRSDDGGKPMEGRAGDDAGDMVFRILSPEKRRLLPLSASTQED